MILDAIAAAERIRGQTFDAQSSLDAIEEARVHLSRADDELRGQHTTIKDRVTWLIVELDRLAAQFKKLKDAPK
jgi:hypothetical protein